MTVSIPQELGAELDRVCRAEGLSRSEVVRQSLRDHLWVRRFRRLRRQMIPRARAMGIFTDEDVFRTVS